jgi:hypothetical protein
VAVARSLVVASTVFVVKKQYDKAEPYLERAVHIEEALFGNTGINIAGPLGSLCRLYDAWGKAEQADACDRRMVGVLEKQYGANNPAIVMALQDDSKQLRALGRIADANAVDKRLASIRAGTMKSN